MHNNGKGSTQCIKLAKDSLMSVLTDGLQYYHRHTEKYLHYLSLQKH